MTARQDEMRRFFTDNTSSALEFGALASPILTDKTRVRYVDHCSRSELLAKYDGHPDEFKSKIVDVDLIWAGGNLTGALLDHGPVDLIIASHVIEHVPNLVGWLQQLQRLLTPNGVISLAVPNKLRTFDFDRPVSTLGDILEAHYLNAERPSIRHVVDQRRYAVRYKERNSWDEDVSRDELAQVFVDPMVWMSFIDRWQKGDYIDSHCWVFVPASFTETIESLCAMGLVDLSIPSRPVEFGHEFIVHLRKGSPSATHDGVPLGSTGR